MDEMNNSDLIERLKEDAEHLEKLGWDAAMHDVYEAIAALSPVLPDEVDKILNNKIEGGSLYVPKQARDLIEWLYRESAYREQRRNWFADEAIKLGDENDKLQQRIEELTEENKENGTALNNALLTIKELQQRIEAYEKALEDIANNDPTAQTRYIARTELERTNGLQTKE